MSVEREKEDKSGESNAWVVESAAHREEIMQKSAAVLTHHLDSMRDRHMVRRRSSEYDTY